VKDILKTWFANGVLAVKPQKDVREELAAGVKGADRLAAGSIQNDSGLSGLLPIAAALMLPVSASYADTFVLSADLTGALEIPLFLPWGAGTPR
jgi:hypothetical protein